MKVIRETLGQALAFTSDFTPAEFRKLTESLDPTWISEALAATGTATVRTRRLPAEQIVALMIGVAVMRDLPIWVVAQQLDVALPAPDGSRTVASSALSQARARVGPEPMEWLFLRSSEEWGHRSAGADRWRGFALYGVDGTSLRVADSQENRSHFGSHTSGRGAGGRKARHSGYPLLRLVVLMALRSHMIVAASFGPYATSEQAYAAALWDSVPDYSLVLVDRQYLDAGVLVPLMTTGQERHWVTRAKSTTKFTVVQRVGRGDAIVEFKVRGGARRKNTSLPTHFDARAIRYQRKGYRPQLLLTSLVDHEKYPADEIRALYHERWEIELGFGELKTDMLDRFETIRSKHPSLVAQEMWGLLIAYNLVRLEMQRLAEEFGIAPTRISFVAALRHCVEQWHLAMVLSPGTLPKHLATATDRMRTFVLPPRRPERVFPRAVKLKMSNYPRKVPTTVSSRKAAK